MKFSPDETALMLRALALAEQGRGRVEPNPCVGAVVARGTRVVGEGFHRRYGGPHAEIEALRVAGRRARGASLYVTLEPCSHFGKTPPCVEAIRAVGIRRVVAAVRDPNPVAARGAHRLRAAGMEVHVGLLARAARDLNRWYFHWHGTGAPYVTAKWAMTLDGKIATDSGDARWVTSRTLREQMRSERSRYAAIVVGIGTVLADDPELAAPRPLARVVLDSRLRMPPRARLARPGTLVFCRPKARGAGALERRGVEIVRCHPHDWRVVLRELARRGLASVLVEGGARVLGTLFAARAVHEVVACIAPKVAGGARSPVAGASVRRMARAWRGRDVEVETWGSEVVVRCRIR